MSDLELPYRIHMYLNCRSIRIDVLELTYKVVGAHYTNTGLVEFYI
jgi:hypothetical protein